MSPADFHDRITSKDPSRGFFFAPCTFRGSKVFWSFSKTLTVHMGSPSSVVLNSFSTSSVNFSVITLYLLYTDPPGSLQSQQPPAKYACGDQQARPAGSQRRTARANTFRRWPHGHALLLAVHVAVLDFKVELGVEGNRFQIDLIRQERVLTLPVVAELAAWVPLLLVWRILLASARRRLVRRHRVVRAPHGGNPLSLRAPQGSRNPCPRHAARAVGVCPALHAHGEMSGAPGYTRHPALTTDRVHLKLSPCQREEVCFSKKSPHISRPSLFLNAVFGVQTEGRFAEFSEQQKK
jgi:hypothetical protein